MVNVFAEYDDELIPDLTLEREYMTRMFNILEKNGNNISEHYYGHFHSKQITMNRYTNHYLLHINQFY